MNKDDMVVTPAGGMTFLRTKTHHPTTEAATQVPVCRVKKVQVIKIQHCYNVKQKSQSIVYKKSCQCDVRYCSTTALVPLHTGEEYPTENASRGQQMLFSKQASKLMNAYHALNNPPV